MDSFPKKCGETDRPIAALIRDLKQRGLLDETLVVWGGEFGRTSMNEERNGSKKLGRDHHPDAFTMWMAGGGVKKGISYGATDELGYFIAEDPVHVRDLQATILHLMGLDPHELRFPYLGLQQRLIGPAEGPRVVHEVLS
jgi:arylsulfatase A-like enzyme